MSIPQGGQNKFFGQKVSRPGINVLNATDNQLIYKNDYTSTLYYNQAGVPTVLLGTRTFTGEQGLFVSQTGVDVTQASNEQLIFNSNVNTLQAVDSGQLTIPAVGASSSQSVTYIHGLGYIPMVFAFFEYQSNSYVQLPYTYWGSSMVPAWSVQITYLDKSIITFTVQTNSGNSFNVSNNVYFVLLQSPAISID